MREIARNSFADGPDWRIDDYNLRHLFPEYVRETRFGFVHRWLAAGPDGRASGYVFFQHRANGDLYLMELAAIPRSADARIRRSGACLLAVALDTARRAGLSGLATVNIVRAAGQTHTDPIGFYDKFGYQTDRAAVGYRTLGMFRSPGDVWMTADIRAALQRALAYLAS